MPFNLAPFVAISIDSAGNIPFYLGMENNPVKILRPLMEAGIPESLRSPDWNQRWNEWEAYCDAPIEIKQIAANGKPMVEEIRRASENGNLRAEECLSLINQQFATSA